MATKEKLIEKVKHADLEPQSTRENRVTSFKELSETMYHMVFADDFAQVFLLYLSIM